MGVLSLPRFTIKNVSSGLFLVLEDLQGINLESSAEVVTGDFPTCWEIEVMENAGSAEDDEGEDDDVYARYVKVCDVLPRAGLTLIVLIPGWRAQRWPRAPREATQEHR